MRQAKTRPILRSDAEIASAMDTWGTAVYRLALVATGSRADADDVYQDVFLRYAMDATVYEDPSHLRAWLLRVTANRCRDIHRAPWHRRWVGPEALDGMLDEEVPDPAVALEYQDLWQAVERLAPKERAAIHLVYGEGLSCNEAADILKTQPSTLRTRLQRARNHLKTLLGEGWA